MLFLNTVSSPSKYIICRFGFTFNFSSNILGNFLDETNKSLEFDFEKTDDHEVYYNIDEDPLAFSKFYYFVEQGEIEYYLVNNRNPEGFLIPEMNKVDFFIIIHQYIDKEDLNFILTRLNKLSDIQVAAQIDPLKLKSKENLVM